MSKNYHAQCFIEKKDPSIPDITQLKGKKKIDIKGRT